MSGLEIIGLALGIFPLLVSALEHYRNVHHALGLIAHFETKYRKTLDDIKYEQLLFRFNLTELLLSILGKDDSHDEFTLERLIADPGGPEWHDDDYAQALEDRLGQARSQFMEIVQSLHELLSELLFSLISNKPTLQAKVESRVVSGYVFRRERELTVGVQRIYQTHKARSISSQERRWDAF